jgi:hypothetical protein
MRSSAVCFCFEGFERFCFLVSVWLSGFWWRRSRCCDGVWVRMWDKWSLGVVMYGLV